MKRSAVTPIRRQHPHLSLEDAKTVARILQRIKYERPRGSDLVEIERILDQCEGAKCPTYTARTSAPAAVEATEDAPAVHVAP